MDGGLIFAIGSLFLTILQLVCAFACVNEAKRKGRSNNLWVLAAVTFGVIAYIVILCLPSKKAHI